MNFSNFRLDVATDGIMIATWDMPGRSMNVITGQVMDELSLIIDKVIDDSTIKGCIITSGKDTFSGGADLEMLSGWSAKLPALVAERGEEEALRVFFEDTGRLSRLYRRLETCGKPFAAAIHGVCLGGAFELALSCHFRIASDARETRLGLPEISVGLFPGAGGTQRVTRLMPTADALQLLSKGKVLNPSNAMAAGLIHEVAPRAEIVSRARQWILEGGSSVASWDAKGYRLPSGKVYSPEGIRVWSGANAIYRRETQDNYPAMKALLQAAYEGLQLPMDDALRVESRYLVQVLRSKQALAMIRSMFISLQALNKGARRPKDQPPTNISRVGVVGAGFMGAGIAYVSAMAGFDVILLDRDMATAEKGREIAIRTMDAEIEKGRAKERDKEKLLSKLMAAASYTDLSNCDLVIEAVFEDPDVKAEVLRMVEQVIPEHAFIGTNTSTLPISGLARALKRPERLVGIHFFSPVDKMKLIEIIKGKVTCDTALAVAFDYSRAIRKTPIMVNDARGFFANRCVGAYILEGCLMFLDGVPPAMIENAGKQAGMPVGPLALLDEVGIDLMLHIVRATLKFEGEQVDAVLQEELFARIVEMEGRKGRKNRKGFYDYPDDGQKHLWPGLAGLQPRKLSPESVDFERLKQRLLAVQALAAAEAFEQGIVTDPREADVGSILGFGFAPFTGGVLSYIDMLGAENFVAICRKLQTEFGDRFAPPGVLIEQGAFGLGFYR